MDDVKYETLYGKIGEKCEKSCYPKYQTKKDLFLDVLLCVKYIRCVIHGFAFFHTEIQSNCLTQKTNRWLAFMGRLNH